MFIFLKAMIPGGAGADLFAQTVQVQGHTTKHGTFVAQHQSTRHKRLPSLGVAQHELFAAPAPASVPKPKQAQADLFAAPPQEATPKPPPKPEPKPEPEPEATGVAAMRARVAGMSVDELHALLLAPETQEMHGTVQAPIYQALRAGILATRGPDEDVPNDHGVYPDALEGPGLAAPKNTGIHTRIASTRWGFIPAYSFTLPSGEHAGFAPRVTGRAYPTKVEAARVALAAISKQLRARRLRTKGDEAARDRFVKWADAAAPAHEPVAPSPEPPPPAPDWRDAAMAAEADYYKPIKMRAATPMFRAISPDALADLATTGKVVGRSNVFSGDPRGHAFFGDEISHYLIHQGEELERQAQTALNASPVGAALTAAEATREAANLAVMRAPVGSKGRHDLVDALHEANDDYLDARKAYRTALDAWIKDAKPKRAAMPYTSAIIETKPLDSGLHYSTDHGQSGSGSLSEYGFQHGQVTADDVATVHLVKDGKVVRSAPLQEAARLMAGEEPKPAPVVESGPEPVVGINQPATPGPAQPAGKVTRLVLQPLSDADFALLKKEVAKVVPGARVLRGMGSHKRLARIFPAGIKGADGKADAGHWTPQQSVALHRLLAAMGAGDVGGAQRTPEENWTSFHGITNVGRVQTNLQPAVPALVAPASPIVVPETAGPQDGDRKTIAGEEYELRGSRWHRVSDGLELGKKPAKPELPAGHEGNVLLDDAAWQQAMMDAANAKWDRGETVSYRTQTHVHHIPPAYRQSLRMVNGQVMAASGIRLKGLDGDGWDTLAAGLGLPTSFQRSTAKAEAAEAARDPVAEAAKLREAAVTLAPLRVEMDRLAQAMERDHTDQPAEQAFYAAKHRFFEAAEAMGLDITDPADLDAEPVVGINQPENLTGHTEAWAVPPGTKPAARRALNDAAILLLRDKADADMTAADREALAKYTGQGGAGVGDSPNEFYTDPAVAAAMWAMLRSCGWNGGTVLEPSCGTGVFMRTAPDDARVVAVEMDPTSSRIARILHGGRGHEVNCASMERFATQDGRLYSAVIGNVPFGVRGGVVRDDKPHLASAEAYFYDTALDKVEDGGLVALIVPTTLMDSKPGRAFRESLLRKGEFVASHRLPNTAFEAAHTEVTSDIVIMRKRPQALAGALSTVPQEALRELGLWDSEFLSGAYATTGRGTGYVMGSTGTAMRQFGPILTVNGSMSGVPEALAAWRPSENEMLQPQPSMDAVLATLGDDEAARRRALAAAARPAYVAAVPGDVRVLDGVRYVLQGEPPRWHRCDETMAPAVLDALPIAELLSDLHEGRAEDPAARRADLALALDEYVAQHGIPARSKDLLRWLDAPTLPVMGEGSSSSDSMSARELRDRTALLLGAVGRDGAYSDLVTGAVREIEAASFGTQAERLALQDGGFTADGLARTMKQDRDAVLDQLFASPDYCVEADGVTWTTADAYCSGDMWVRLDAARTALDRGGLAPEYQAKYEAQVAALDAAIDPQSLEDVEVELSSGFITPAVLSAWFAARADDFAADNPTASWGPGYATWHEADGVWSYRASKGPTGTGHTHNHDAVLVETLLNRTGVRKDDRDRLARMNREFRSWLLGSEYRDQVEDHYNRTYRGFRAPAYSDEPIAIPGLTADRVPKDYHWRSLRWALSTGTGIVAADVGLGKTVRGMMLAKLAKATGQAKKPAFVVPKSVLANWVQEAETWFPGSRVLVVGETYTRNKAGELVSKADDEKTRRSKLQELRQNDYDFVFISAPTWDALDVSPEMKERFIADDFWQKRKEALEGSSSKKQEAARLRHEQTMAAREFANKEGTIFFDELGVDMLVMDEMHAYKNLYAARNRFGESPKFLGGSGQSKRALDTNFKTKALREANGGKGIFGLTATPTKNSPLEIYSMLSHIAPEAFDKLGIKNSEDFLDRFCTFADDKIVSVTGDIEDALVVTGFKNLGELRSLMRRYIDRQTAEEVGLELPKAEALDHMVEMSPAQKAAYAGLRALANDKQKKDDADGHLFSIISKMDKASLDTGLLDMEDPDHSPKIEAFAAQAAKGATEGGQVAFCEALPSYPKIIARLVAHGIPRERIGVINAKAAPSAAARQKIANDFNSGKLDVVLGNKSMEEGLNLQTRTSDIHHLDLPWNAASLHQRNGRGVRQGNTRKGIRLHSYLAKGSFDGYRYQTIRGKRSWTDELWNGGDQVANGARDGKASWEDMMVMFSADPEEARTKLDADKVAARERDLAQARGKMGDAFGRYREMARSVASMKEKGIKGAAMERAEGRMVKLRDSLQDNPLLADKSLLDGKTAAVVEPATGHIFKAGTGLDIQPGGPLHEGKPSRWVVTGVDEAEGTVSVRRFGSMSPYPAVIRVADMQSKVSPFEVDAKAETDAIEAEMTRLQAEEGAKAASKIAGGLKLEDLRAMPAELLQRQAPMIQKVLKDGLKSYSTGTRPTMAFVHDAGHPVLVKSYHAHDKAADHDLMLPTPENKEKAINAYVEMSLARDIKTRTQQGRGRYGNSHADGVKPAFDGYDYDSSISGHPWAYPIRDLWGDGAVAEADKRAKAAAVDGIDRSADLAGAVRLASTTLALPDYGGEVQRSHWRPDVVRAVAGRAAALGVLDKPLSDVLSGQVSNYGRGKLHGDLFKVNGHDHYVKASYRAASTVRDWLEALPGGKEAEPDKEAA